MHPLNLIYAMLWLGWLGWATWPGEGIARGLEAETYTEAILLIVSFFAMLWVVPLLLGFICGLLQ